MNQPHSHLFIAITNDTDELGTVEIFAGPSLEILKNEGHLDQFEIKEIHQIPDDFYMEVQIGSFYSKRDEDPRFFFASPGGAGQGSAEFLADAIDFFGHVTSTAIAPFVELLYKGKGKGN